MIESVCVHLESVGALVAAAEAAGEGTSRLPARSRCGRARTFQPSHGMTIANAAGSAWVLPLKPGWVGAPSNRTVEPLGRTSEKVY